MSDVDLDRTSLRVAVNELYQREHDALGDKGTYQILDDAEKWDLTDTLANGGVVTFAHVNVADCGLHVAAAVNAALDTGADTVLAISVLHAFSEEMELARRDVSSGGSSSDHAMWGIQGPGLEFLDDWRGDHAMRSLRHFWAAETRRRGITDRRLVERYPFLAGGRPGDLPNIDEVAGISENAVILATGDQFHHGIAYGTPPDEALAPEPAGLVAATESIKRGIALVASGDYWGYDQHCVVAKSDDRDAAQLYMYLRGPLQGELIDIGWSDSTELYGAPAPTWAAGGFVKFEKVDATASSLPSNAHA